MANAPAPTECHSLQFKQLCKLKTRHDTSKLIYQKPTFLVATASHYGLLIVGEKIGLKVIPVNEVFEKELPNHNPLNELQSYTHRNIILPSPPSHIDLNANHELLGVIFQLDETPILRVYKTESLFYKDVIVCNEVRLSSIGGTFVTDFSWNPNVPNIVTCCVSDGSLCVLTFLANGSYEVKSLPTESNSTCFCWSPKGKQIVVGDNNGTLTQYVPELRAVKSCPPPATIFDKPCTIRGIKWLSNFQFIGVYTLQQYHSQNDDPKTSIVVINTPKNGPVTYVNYDDVCFSSGIERPCQFYFIHIPLWNLLFVASANAVEVAVMSLNPDGTSWSLRILDDSARITLPMCKSNETFPVGISIDYCARIRTSVGDNIVAMPMISLLTNEGIICLYLINYLEPSAPSICSETNFKGSLQYFTRETITNEKHEEKFASPVKSETKNFNSVPQYNSPTQISYDPNKNTTLPVSYSHQIKAAPTNSVPLLFNNANVLAQPNLSKGIDTNTVAPLTAMNESQMPETSNRTPENLTTQKSVPAKSASGDAAKKTVELRSGNDALKKFKKAASAFQNDVREVRYLVECIKIDGIGKKENNERLGRLRERVNRLKSSLSGVHGELDAIKTSIMETFACIQEIRTKQFKLTHPGYQTLSSLRDLEPTNLTSLKNVENNINYLRCQIEKAAEQLDEIWRKHSERNRTGDRFPLPVFDNIYATIVQQLKIFKLLELQTEKFQKQLASLKVRTSCRLPAFDKINSDDAKTDSSLANLAKNALNLNNDTDLRSDLKTLANKYAVDHAKRFHLCHNKRTKLQELHSASRVTYIRSNRLQRLKKKSLIILSKSSFVNDADEPNTLSATQPSKEELKPISSIASVEEHHSNDDQRTNDIWNTKVPHSTPLKSNIENVADADASNTNRVPPTTELKGDELLLRESAALTVKENAIADKQRTTMMGAKNANGMAFVSATMADACKTHFPPMSNASTISRSLFSVEKAELDKPKTTFSLPGGTASTSPSLFSGISSVSATSSSGSLFSTLMGQGNVPATTKENVAVSFASATNSAATFPSSINLGGNFVSSPTTVLGGPSLSTSLFSGRLTAPANGSFVSSSVTATSESFGSLFKTPASGTSIASFAGLTSTLSFVTTEPVTIPKPSVTSAFSVSQVITKPSTTTIVSSSEDNISNRANSFINFGSALAANLGTKPVSTGSVPAQSDRLSSFSFSSKINDSVSISRVPAVAATEGAESSKVTTVQASAVKSDLTFSSVSSISAPQTGSVEKLSDATRSTMAPISAEVSSLAPASSEVGAISSSSTSSAATSVGASAGFFSAAGFTASSSSPATPSIGVASSTTTVSPFASITTSPPTTTTIITMTTNVTPVTSKSTDATFGNVGSFFGELNIASATTGSSTTSFFSKPTSSVSIFGDSAASPVTTCGQSSIFGQGTTTPSVFGQALNTPSEENKSIFGSTASSFASNTQPSIFGGSSLFGSASVFGNSDSSATQPSSFAEGTRSSIFGGANAGFNAASGNSAFQSVSGSFPAPISFTGPTAQTENTNSGFGSPPSFSSVFNKSSPSFPAFGGAPTFGGSPAFGNSPTKVFGQTTANLGTFGSTVTQQPTAFENLASENTISFGNLAQQPGNFGSSPSFGNTNTSPSFGSSNFGGNSFSSWRQ